MSFCSSAFLGRTLDFIVNPEAAGPGFDRDLEGGGLVRRIVAAASSGEPSFFFKSMVCQLPPLRGTDESNAPS